MTNIDIADLARVTGGDNAQATGAVIFDNPDPACIAAKSDLRNARVDKLGTILGGGNPDAVDDARDKVAGATRRAVRKCGGVFRDELISAP